jgi:hypothetical protein
MAELPENFKTIITDFTNDLSVTFPEYVHLWEKWTHPSEADLAELFQYCVKTYPERFFDIIYQKDAIFGSNDDTVVHFLPNVDFKLLFSCDDVSEQTKKTIWKYLQLILFTIVGGIKDKTSFGDAANMFEGIGEDDLQKKLLETMDGITDFFQSMSEGLDPGAGSGTGPDFDPFKSFFGKGPGPGAEGSEGGEGANGTEGAEGADGTKFEDFKKKMEGMGMPDIGKIQEHLKTIFDGKIGKLAKEMAEEISGDFSDLLGKDAGDIKNPQDIMKKLMKDPKKVMDLMKTVGSKLDDKMKSGEISREELMKEASEMMGKMKDMGGGDGFGEMFKNMAKNMGKNMKVDTNALDRMTKMMSTKERLRAKVEQNKQKKEAELAQELAAMKKRLDEQDRLLAKYSLENKGENNMVFKLDGVESQEKSFIHPDLLKEIAEEEAKKLAGPSQNNANKKKKKGKR